MQTVDLDEGKRFFRLFTEYVRQSAHRDENLPNGRPSTTVSVVSRLQFLVRSSKSEMLPANRSASLIDAVVDPNELWNEGRNFTALLLARPI
jgi:hypothetical protein